MRRIASRQNAIVGRYREAVRREAPDVVLLDGAHLIAEALAAGVRIREAAVVAELFDDEKRFGLLEPLHAPEMELAVVTAPVMAALSPTRSPSGVVALADRPAFDEKAVFAGHDPLVVVACDVQDPGNLGAIVRVAEAAGATGVIVAGASADPFGWKALRGSMGSSLRLPLIVEKGSFPLAAVRARGCRVVATLPRGGRPAFECNMTGALAIVIGSEGAGLPPAALADADERITIPMRPPVESLNAAVTTALLVYEAQRQRHGFAVR